MTTRLELVKQHLARLHNDAMRLSRLAADLQRRAEAQLRDLDADPGQNLSSLAGFWIEDQQTLMVRISKTNACYDLIVNDAWDNGYDKQNKT